LMVLLFFPPRGFGRTLCTQTALNAETPPPDGTIINLYLIPRRQGPNDLRAAQVAATLVSERLVAPPCVIGPALTAHDRLIQPQEATGFPNAEFLQVSRRYFELPQTFSNLSRGSKPQIVAFSSLDERTPAIRADFKHYMGLECSVGLYVAPKGTRLSLKDAIEGYAVLDVTIFEWLHLQGKAAPWIDIFSGSCLDRAIKPAWPSIDVVENDSP